MTQPRDEDREAKLRQLQKQFDKNEELMRQAAIKYKDLVAAKEDLLANMAALKKSRGQKPSAATRR